MGVVRLLGLGRDDLDLGRQRRKRQAGARDHAAAADRRHDRIQPVDLLDQFLGRGRNREAAGIAGIALMRLGIVDVADLVGHAPPHHHGAGQLAGLLDVAGGAVRHAFLAILDDLGGLAGHGHGQLLLGLVLVEVQAVHFRQGHHHPKRAAARDDRGLVDRIALRQRQPDDGVARLVIGGQALFFLVHRHGAALRAHQHLVLGVLEVAVRDHAPVLAGRGQRRLVDQVRQIGAREAGRAARDGLDVDVGGQRHVLHVDAQDALAARDVGVGHHDLTAEPAGSTSCSAAAFPDPIKRSGSI